MLEIGLTDYAKIKHFQNVLAGLCDGLGLGKRDTAAVSFDHRCMMVSGLHAKETAAMELMLDVERVFDHYRCDVPCQINLSVYQVLHIVRKARRGDDVTLAAYVGSDGPVDLKIGVAPPENIPRARFTLHLSQDALTSAFSLHTVQIPDDASRAEASIKLSSGTTHNANSTLSETGAELIRIKATPERLSFIGERHTDRQVHGICLDYHVNPGRLVNEDFSYDDLEEDVTATLFMEDFSIICRITKNLSETGNVMLRLREDAPATFLMYTLGGDIRYTCSTLRSVLVEDEENSVPEEEQPPPAPRPKRRKKRHAT